MAIHHRLLSGLVLVTLLAGACGTGAELAQAPTSPAAPAPTATSAPAATVPDGAVVEQLFDQVPPLHPSVDGYPRGVVDLVAPDGATTWRLPVLVAATPTDRSHGLMEVEHLPRGTGMAFVFEQDVETGFWMKNTLVPLDIVYVDDGTTVSSTTMTPCTADPCPSYPADGPFDLAVEVPAGFLDAIGFDPTWTVEFSFA